MKTILICSLLLFISSCNLFRLLNTKPENDESATEIETFLEKHDYAYDYSFQNFDFTSSLLKTPKHRINNDSLRYAYIQLRIYDGKGDLYTGYSQCMGDFEERNFLDSLPPAKNTNPFLNQSLKFKDELDIISINSALKSQLIDESSKYEYTFVVYYTIWTNYFSEHVLKEVSKMKRKYPEKVRVILVNTAKNKLG